MKSYRYTLVTLFFASFLYIVGVAFDLDLFERTLEFLHDFEKWEIDEFIIPILIIALGFLWDSSRLLYKKQIELEKQKERIEIFQTTMRTVQDIFGNFLNNLLLFTMQIEDKKTLDDKSIEALNELIYGTAAKLKKIASFTIIVTHNSSKDFHTIDTQKSK